MSSNIQRAEQEKPVRQLLESLSGQWKCDRMTAVPACVVFSFSFPPGSHRQEAAKKTVVSLTSRLLAAAAVGASNSWRSAAMLATVSEEEKNILSVEYNGTFPRIPLICFTDIWGRETISEGSQ